MLSKPLADRFWEKVDVRSPSQCWEWTAAKDRYGYGRMFVDVDNRSIRSHRVSYELNKGAIPEGMFVLHSCNNPKCVNPKHLRTGTQQDNIRDKVLSGTCHRPAGSKHSGSKLTEEQAYAIKAIAKRKLGHGVNDFLSRWLGVNHRTISNIATGKRWRHINVDG